MGSVARTVATAAATAVAAAVALGILEAINAFITPETPWFVGPAALIAFVMVSRYGATVPTESPSLGSKNATFVSVGTGLLIGALGVWLTGWENLTHGVVKLPGDQLPAPDLRPVIAATSFVSAAFTEEAAVRGGIQLRLQATLGSYRAEALADVTFVLLHALRLGDARLLPYLVLISVVNGRLTSLGQRITWPIVTHGTASGIMALVVLWAST